MAPKKRKKDDTGSRENPPEAPLGSTGQELGDAQVNELIVQALNQLNSQLPEELQLSLDQISANELKKLLTEASRLGPDDSLDDVKFEKAILPQIHHHDHEVCGDIGCETCEGLGDDDAESEFQELVSVFCPPNYFDALELVHQALDELPSAERANVFQQAVELCPDCTDAWIALGDSEPHHQKAVQHYEKGLSHAEWMLKVPDEFPEAVETFQERYVFDVLQIATSLWRIGEREKSIDAHLRLDKLTDQDICSHRLQFAYRLFEHGDDKLLKRQMTKLKRSCSSQSGLEYLGVLLAYRESGDAPATGKKLTNAHKRNPLVVKYLLGGYEYPDVESIDIDSEEFELEEESHWVATAVTSASRQYEHFLRWVRDTVDYTQITCHIPPKKFKRISTSYLIAISWTTYGFSRFTPTK